MKTNIRITRLLHNTIFIIFTIVLFNRCQQSDFFEVSSTKKTETVYVSGKVFPDPYYYVTSNISNKVSKVFVKNGDYVKKGDTLLVLENADIENISSSLLSNLNLLENLESNPKVAILLERMNYVQKEYQKDSLNTQRYIKLQNMGAASLTELENSVLKLEQSKNELKNISNEIINSKLEQEIKYNKLKYEYLKTQKERNQNIIKSELSGKVYMSPVNIGQLIQSNEPIMLIGDSSKYRLDLLVDERDIKKIHPHQALLFSVDYEANKRFNTRIEEIYPLNLQIQNYFNITATYKSNEHFYPGAAVEGYVTVFEKNIIIIPTKFIVNRQFVYVREKGLVKIEFIEIDDKHLEVSKGLRGGDVLVKKKDNL